MSEQDEKNLVELQAALDKATQEAKNLRRQLAASLEDQTRDDDANRIDPAARRDEE